MEIHLSGCRYFNNSWRKKGYSETTSNDSWKQKRYCEFTVAVGPQQSVKHDLWGEVKKTAFVPATAIIKHEKSTQK